MVLTITADMIKKDGIFVIKDIQSTHGCGGGVI